MNPKRILFTLPMNFFFIIIIIMLTYISNRFLYSLNNSNKFFYLHIILKDQYFIVIPLHVLLILFQQMLRSQTSFFYNIRALDSN